MSAIGLADSLRSIRANAIITAIDAGASLGIMQFYDAPRPAKGAAITTQTLLATATFALPAGTSVDGVLTFDTIADDELVDADGDAAWVRVLDGDGAFVLDMDVTDTEGAGPVKLFSTHLRAGGVLSISSAVFIEGNA